MMLAELVRQTGVPPDCGVGGKAEGALAMMHAMQTMYGGTPMDPFIGQCSASSAVVEAHARQNSTDSGLGTPLSRRGLSAYCTTCFRRLSLTIVSGVV